MGCHIALYTIVVHFRSSRLCLQVFHSVSCVFLHNFHFVGIGTWIAQFFFVCRAVHTETEMVENFVIKRSICLKLLCVAVLVSYFSIICFVQRGGRKSTFVWTTTYIEATAGFILAPRNVTNHIPLPPICFSVWYNFRTSFFPVHINSQHCVVGFVCVCFGN